MTNFAFLPNDFRPIAESAMRAEGHVMGDPRAACFHARFTLEAIVHWLYRHDASLRTPYDQSLGALLHEPCFQNLLPEAVFQNARVIQKVGNQAVHSSRPIRQYDALQAVKELHHLCHWLTRTYQPDASRDGADWKDERVPPAPDSAEVVPRKKLEALEKKLTEQNEEALKRQQERGELDAEFQALREQLAEVRAASEREEAGGRAATSRLGKARPLPRGSSFAGEPGVQRLQGAPA